MNKLSMVLGLVFVLLISCEDKKNPQVIYDDTVSDVLTMDNVLEDTTKVLVTGMPIYLDSTDILIHPIGWDNIYADRKSRYSSHIGSDGSDIKGKSDYSAVGYGVQSNNTDYIAGAMVNMIFENVNTGDQRLLTDKMLLIRYASYLKEAAKKIGSHYILYTVLDKDYNRDGKLDHKDMSAYYMSNLDGTNFTKITQDYHYFDASKLLLRNGKYYFRTIEDVNKDGEFNKKDKYHYYYIDLTKGELNPIEYFPLKMLNLD